MSRPLLLGLFLLLLTWAVVQDLGTRRIRNWLTASLVLSGLALSFAGWGAVSGTDSLIGLAAGLAIPFPLFALRAMGGGDVKLLMGIGAWVGGWTMLTVLAVTAIAGGALVIAQALWQRTPIALLRRCVLLGLNLVHLRQLGMEHVAATARQSELRKAVPYAVPIWIGTVAALFTPVSLLVTGRPV